MADDIGSICLKDTCIGSTYTVGIRIWFAGITSACTGCICAKGAFARDIESRILARLGVILVGPTVNDYYLLLFMRLIFASMERLNC